MHFFISISKLRPLLLLHFTSPEIGMLRNGISEIAEVPAEHWKKGKAKRKHHPPPSANVYLVVFLCDPGGNALAVVAAVGAAGAVSPAALHQEAAWPENGVGLLQLLAQRHGEVARRATVQSNFIP